MKKERIDTLLSQMPAEKVPSGLSARILRTVEIRASQLERRQVFWSAVRLALGVTAVIYGFTATVLNLLNANLSSYWAAVLEDPSVLTTRDGLYALYEQAPLLSGLLFFCGLVYTIRHILVRGVSTRHLSTMMAALFVVVALGSFVGGIAVGANKSSDITAMASSTLFQPLVNTPSDYQYSSTGEVTNVENVNEETVQVTILLPNGTQKTVEIPQSALKDKKVIQEGDKLYILGKPNGFKKPGDMHANFVQFFSKD